MFNYFYDFGSQVAMTVLEVSSFQRQSVTTAAYHSHHVCVTLMSAYESRCLCCAFVEEQLQM